MLEAVAAWRGRRRRPFVFGLSALQGSGKSTFAAQLVAASKARGWRALAFSLDDAYLGRRDRARLAREVHPLFATRGVPGTHDVALVERTLADLARASPTRPARVPRFDKGRDTRLPPSRWHRVTAAPDLVILEGWCVGIGSQSPGALARPVNALERDEDAQRTWRSTVNAALAGDYARLWSRLDRLLVLAAPSFDVVVRWRNEQEDALRRRGAPQAMSPTRIARFVQHYERLSRHGLRTLPARADLVVSLDASRRVRDVRTRD